jgi:L-iditol 2-dehydrogenase
MMKVAYLKKTNQIEFRMEPIPQVGKNQILIKVEACGICGTDVHAALQNEEFLPFGHEVAGRVVELGEGVERLSIGQKVVLDSATPCGWCDNCRNGKHELCTDIQSFYFTHSFGMAEYMVTPAICAIRYEGLTPIQVTLAEPLGVALDLIRVADIRPGNNVLIMGPGPIGLMAIRLAKMAGAQRIFVSALSGTMKRNRLALEFGADAVIEVDTVALEDYKFNCSIDRVVSTSPPSTLPSAMNIAAKGAIIAFIGFAGNSNPNLIFNANEFHVKKLQLRASFASPATMGPLAITILKNDRKIVDHIISHIFELDQLSQAMETAVYKTMETVKIIVKV